MNTRTPAPATPGPARTSPSPGCGPRNRAAGAAPSPSVAQAQPAAQPDPVKVALAGIDRAIALHMQDLILGGTPGGLYDVFCKMFGATYDAVADARLAIFPPRDAREFERDLRHTVPCAAIDFLTDALNGETLLSSCIRPGLTRALEILRNRLDPTYPRPPGPTEPLIQDLANLLFDEVVRRALRRAAAWPGANPVRDDVAAVHRERFQRFSSEQSLLGVVVSQSMLARSAGVDRTDVRRYLAGEKGPGSVITDRIEAVFDARLPLLDTRGKPVTPSSPKLG